MTPGKERARGRNEINKIHISKKEIHLCKNNKKNMSKYLWPTKTSKESLVIDSDATGLEITSPKTFIA